MGVQKCKDCGGIVSDNADSCPRCGRVIKKKEGCISEFLKLCLFVFLIFIVFDVYKTFSDQNNENENQPIPVEKMETYSTKQISKEFSNNVVRAKKIFENKEIVITGKYISMRENMVTEKIMDVTLSNDIICVFRGATINSLGVLKQGDNIRIKGKYSRKGLLGYTFDSCALLK